MGEGKKESVKKRERKSKKQRERKWEKRDIKRKKGNYMEEGKKESVKKCERKWQKEREIERKRTKRKYGNIETGRQSERVRNKELTYTYIRR